MTYALVADIHFHGWSAFSKVDETGQNTRLTALLNDFRQAGEKARIAGAARMYVAGDLFHVRGAIAPSVLIPVRDVLADLVAQGLEIRILAGNHDMEFKHSSRLGNATGGVDMIGVTLIHSTTVFEDDKVVAVPWHESTKGLREELERVAQDLRDGMKNPGDYDLHIHAPVEGVIMGLDGIHAAWLASLGFKRVFTGHYHNHKVLEVGKVISIGALAHHTWSDVGTEAGWLLVDHRVQHFASTCPKFADFDADGGGEGVDDLVRGNYVRVRVKAGTKPAAVTAIRTELEKLGALGVIIQTTKELTRSRAAAAIPVSHSPGGSISVEASVSHYIKSLALAYEGVVQEMAASVLAEAV
ncbi:metallophosphoesterase [Cupriavidus metallidurans]|uniref:metallophosphoesterase n=1 Tax=Cupriavidus metallidurans TaxID=119219 RepID=UPI001CCD0DF4|nr:metallophosphoesterase [Cupriavidus metallidurans]UBM12712.1 metallophosphoesterase [Cupriavidus metallidurans]